MMRTQIQFTAEQHARLSRWARRLKISVAEAVRRCVDARLLEEGAGTERSERVRAALAVVGKYRDPGGRSRVARDHDRVLAEAQRE